MASGLWRAMQAVVLFTTLAGCKTSAVHRFGDLELEATRYGFISAGAVRAAPYDFGMLKEMRLELIGLIKTLTDDIKAAPKPEFSTASVRITEILANLALAYKGVPDLSGLDKAPDTKNLIATLEEQLKSLFSSAMTAEMEANRIDVIRLRFGYLKFLDSQIENLRLIETLPLDKAKYQRMIVSVQLTALVRHQEARGALVFFDFYPMHADTWAHHAGQRLEELSTKYLIDRFPGMGHGAIPIEERMKAAQVIERQFDSPHGDAWQTHLQFLSPSFVEGFEFPRFKLSPLAFHDYEGWFHHYLIRNGFLPKIVHVDPLDVGELFNELNINLTTVRAALSAGADFSQTDALLSAVAGYSAARGEKGQRVNPLSVAFAAGNSRAGWLFLPSVHTQESPISLPTERRIRMVVDVPKGLRSVALHVHKSFTDESLLPIRGLTFDKQLRQLNHARHLLSASEKSYPGDHVLIDPAANPNTKVTALDFRTPTNWELMKSRMRNILYQGWSESLSFEVPSEEPIRAIPDQTVVLEDDGERTTTVLLTGGRGLASSNIKAALEVTQARTIEVMGLMVPVELRQVSLVPHTVEAEPSKSSVTLKFLSLAKIKASLQPQLLLMSQASVRTSFEQVHLTPKTFPAIHLVLKAPDKPTGFEISVGARFVQIREDGTGDVHVLLKKPKKLPSAKTVQFQIVGADLVAPTQPVEVKDQLVTLKLKNLTERAVVIIAAKNEADVSHSPITIHAERLPVEPDDDE